MSFQNPALGQPPTYSMPRPATNDLSFTNNLVNRDDFKELIASYIRQQQNGGMDVMQNKPQFPPTLHPSPFPARSQPESVISTITKPNGKKWIVTVVCGFVFVVVALFFYQLWVKKNKKAAKKDVSDDDSGSFYDSYRQKLLKEDTINMDTRDGYFPPGYNPMPRQQQAREQPQYEYYYAPPAEQTAYSQAPHHYYSQGPAPAMHPQQPVQPAMHPPQPQAAPVKDASYRSPHATVFQADLPVEFDTTPQPVQEMEEEAAP